MCMNNSNNNYNHLSFVGLMHILGLMNIPHFSQISDLFSLCYCYNLLCNKCQGDNLLNKILKPNLSDWYSVCSIDCHATSKPT